MARGHIDLDDPGNRTRFEEKLGACLYAAAARNQFTQRQTEFIKDMDYRLKNRDGDKRLGVTWNPTVSQYNWLHSLWEDATR